MVAGNRKMISEKQGSLYESALFLSVIINLNKTAYLIQRT